jgi:hypothetical protein
MNGNLIKLCVMASRYSGTDDNAAGRLWKVLTAVLSFAGGQTHAQFAKAFGLESADALTVVRELTLAIEAVDEIETRVKRIPNVSHDLFLHSISPVRQALVAAIQNYDFNQWKGHLKAEYLPALLFCSDLLSKHCPEQEISQDELLTLTKVLNDLYESVFASQIDGNLKLIILEQLQNIQKSIREYRVKGVYVLKQSLSAATGQIILHSAEFQAARSTEDGALLQKFLDVLSFLDKITSVATKSKELLSPLLPVLLAYFPPLLEAAKHAH